MMLYKSKLDSSIADKNRNIVLIGGKNGAGKTTFFKSIKTCLYGCKVWGYDASGKDYFNIISNLVNMKMQYDIEIYGNTERKKQFDDLRSICEFEVQIRKPTFLVSGILRGYGRAE